MPLDFKKENKRYRQKCGELSIAPTPKWIYVSIKAQKLRLMDGDMMRSEWLCSTSNNPPSCHANSYGTPTGLHSIGEKIGAEAPSGAVFKGRVQVCDHHSQLPDLEQAQNLITSRILRLSGMDPAHNAGPVDNAWERYVYIHGTNHPERLGQPFSAGCVLLSDATIIALYEAVDVGDWVWIE